MQCVAGFVFAHRLHSNQSGEESRLLLAEYNVRTPVFSVRHANAALCARSRRISCSVWREGRQWVETKAATLIRARLSHVLALSRPQFLPLYPAFQQSAFRLITSAMFVRAEPALARSLQDRSFLCSWDIGANIFLKNTVDFDVNWSILVNDISARCFLLNVSLRLLIFVYDYRLKRSFLTSIHPLNIL